MNTAEMASDIANETELSKVMSRKVLNFILGRIVSEVKKGNDVRFSGFGSFYKVKRQARQGRNPQNGEVVLIPSVDIPRFKPGKTFKDAIKSGKNVKEVEPLRAVSKKKKKAKAA